MKEICIYVKLCFGGNNMNTDIIAVIIAGIALIISYLSYLESKKNRLEYGRAFLAMELLQTKTGLYAIISNIGNTYAYDMKVTSPSCFTNGFDNLETIRPGYTYRFLVMNGQDVSNYPEEVSFLVTYRDYYSSKHVTKKEFCFKLVDHLKFNVTYNQEFQCYDITKSF